MKYGVNRQILLITAGTVWIIAGANILVILRSGVQKTLL